MVEINYNGTVYCGRLVSITAIEDVTRTLIENHYEDIYKNIGYDVILMDAFGATVYLQLDTLDNLKFY